MAVPSLVGVIELIIVMVKVVIFIVMVIGVGMIMVIRMVRMKEKFLLIYTMLSSLTFVTLSRMNATDN